MNNTAFADVDVVTLARIFGLVVPLLVGVITKKWASDGVKSIANVVLSSVAGSVALVLGSDGGDGLTRDEFFNAIINSFLCSIMAYYGVLKPTGLAGTVAEKTAAFGVGGKPPAMETADKGAESPYERDDAGAGTLGTIGAVLLLLGILLLVLSLLNLIGVTIVAAIAIAFIGLVLYLVDGNGSRL